MSPTDVAVRLDSPSAMFAVEWPESLRVFFGDGVLLVAAWVGIWYPLDTLIYIPAPLRRDRQVLTALRDAESRVQAA